MQNQTKKYFAVKNLHLMLSVIIVVPIALTYGLFPAYILPKLFDFNVNSIDLTLVFRAIMGLYLGMSIFWIIGILKPKFWYAATLTNIVFMGSLALGRISSLIIDGLPSNYFILGLVVEFFLSVFAIKLMLDSQNKTNFFKTSIIQLVFATNNKNKILEVQQLLPENIQLLSLESIGCLEDIPETAETIEGNAIMKANYVTQKYGYDCFADDTGLEIEALNGIPGVNSAHYAGPQRNAEDNMNLVLENLKNKTNRTAQFKTCIALNLNRKQHLFTGIAKGEITLEKQGFQGFGYDPIFKPEGFSDTFAQISLEDKGKISHRGKATQLLIEFLKTN